MLSPTFGHFFPDRFEQIRNITVLTVHKGQKASWWALTPFLTQANAYLNFNHPGKRFDPLNVGLNILNGSSLFPYASSIYFGDKRQWVNNLSLYKDASTWCRYQSIIFLSMYTELAVVMQSFRRIYISLLESSHLCVLCLSDCFPYYILEKTVRW